MNHCAACGARYHFFMRPRDTVQAKPRLMGGAVQVGALVALCHAFGVAAGCVEKMGAGTGVDGATGGASEKDSGTIDVVDVTDTVRGADVVGATDVVGVADAVDDAAIVLDSAAGGLDTASAVRLCDGSSGVRLAMSSGGSGQVDPGTALLGENGDHLLLVDGTCHVWVLDMLTSPLRTLILSPEQEQALYASLKLGEWGAFAPRVYGGCADGPFSTFRFGDIRLSGPACGLAAGSPWSDLNAAFGTVTTNLAAGGTPSTWDLHYLVVKVDTSAGGRDLRTPASWPLSVPLEQIAVEGVGSYDSRNSLRATGSDAAALRAIRSDAGNADAGGGGAFRYTLLKGAGSERYGLYMRDALPFEAEKGGLPASTF